MRGLAGHRRALLGAMAACAAPAWTACAAGATHAGGTGTDGGGGWFSAFGLRIKVEVATASTGGAMSTTCVVSTPGSGSPAHPHTCEDEVFVILRGYYRFWQAGGPATDAAPKVLVRQHRGVVHQYRNVGDDEGEHLLIYLPGGLEALFVAGAREGLVASRESSYAQSTSSSNAVAGSITSGGPLTVSSGGNATFTGTTLSSGGDNSVSVSGNVSFDAARSTSKTQEFGVTASVGASSEKETNGGRTTSTSEKSMGVSGNYGQSSSDTAQAASVQSGGNVSITSGGNTRFESTDINAVGAVGVGAGGTVQMDLARSTSSTFAISGSVEGSASREREGPVAGAAAATPQRTTTAPAAAAGGAKPAARVDKAQLLSDATLSYKAWRSSQATTLQGGGVTISSGAAVPAQRP